MATIAVELASGEQRTVMYADASDLRVALATHSVDTLYDAHGTIITPEALALASKINAVFAMSPRSRARRYAHGRVQSAWAAACTAATFALLLRWVDIIVPPEWLIAMGLSIGTWELSLGTQKCARSAAAMAITAAIAVAHWDDARDALVRLLYAAAEPQACSWLGCRVRHACSLHWSAAEYCAQSMKERVSASLSYVCGAAAFATVWSATRSMPTPIRTVCAACLAYCAKAICGATDVARWVPEPPIID